MSGIENTDSPPVSTAECSAFMCPYCGECTIEQFLSEAGCPRLKFQQESSASEKVLFPYLDTSCLCEADQINLEYRLESETKKMIIAFAKFKANIIRSLEHWGVPLERIKHSILSLEAFSHSIGVRVLDEKDKHAIKSAKTLSDVFIVLCDYTSFINYEIIEYIIYQHGATKDHESLEDYQKLFQNFCQRNIFEVPQGMFSSTSRKSAKVFALKCTKMISTMKSVLEVKGKIAEIFDLQPAALQLCSVEKGCVELHFLIAAQVADHIFPVASSQHSALSEIGIRVIFCEGVEQTLIKEKKSDTTVVLTGKETQSDPVAAVYVHRRLGMIADDLDKQYQEEMQRELRKMQEMPDYPHSKPGGGELYIGNSALLVLGVSVLAICLFLYIRKR